MATYDPTSVAHSLPTLPGRRWTVRQVATLQRQAMSALQPPVADEAPAAAAPLAQERAISGRYRATAGEVELELRIDVDGVRPTRRVSGDFFRQTGGTVTYIGSFIVNSPNLVVGDDAVVIEGEGSFNFASGSPKLHISIPTAGALGPPPAATVQFLTPGGVPATSYVCSYESPYFRTLEFELDFVAGVEPFGEYDTGRMPSGGPARRLTLSSAYAEAGIEMVQTDPGDAIAIDLAGADRIWTNRELHAAMETQFSRWGRDPAWRVWLLAATRHERGPGLRGIMFDTEKRQGCAVFHDVIGGTADRVLRAMLRTYMHELGHCFNLYHSHEKDLMHPPQPSRLDALSWMHYPGHYRSGSVFGEGPYWRAFPFQFDDEEIVHLRHAFRDAIIPGGQPFGLGAADVDPSLFADRVRDESGLRLELRAPDRFLLGTPVVVEIKLSLTDLRGRVVNRNLHPKHGYVQIGISRLDGRTTLYRPLMTECVDPEPITLDESQPAIYDSAYIGYGKDGFYFGAAGQYELRAVYQALDGSRVVSNRLRIHIRPPVAAQDEEMADLFFGDEQGTLLYLLGSDHDRLKRGNDAFATAREKYPDHPMTSYACLVEGMNCSRPFKRIENHKIATRSVQSTTADALLSAVVGATGTAAGPNARAVPAPASRCVPRLDNISLGMVWERLASVRREAGNPEGAKQVAHDMWAFFTQREKVPESVEKKILHDLGTIVGTPWVEEMSAGRSTEPSTPGRAARTKPARTRPRGR
jgi:hypothetical protein